jgi:predicted nucleotidyltransferase
VARGDAGIDSDVDLLVEMEPRRTVLDLSELILDLEESLGRHVDVIEAQHLTPQAAQILREAVTL